MTSTPWPLRAPRAPVVRAVAGALALAGSLACVPSVSQAAASYTATQMPYTPPVSWTPPELTVPGASAWPDVHNAMGEGAGTIRRDTFNEIFKGGPFDAAHLEVPGYRFLGTGSNSFGTWANYLGTSQEAFVTRDGKVQALGTLGFGESSSRFINDRGQVAGDLYDRHVSVNIENGRRVANPDGAGFAEDRVRQHAFFYDGSTTKDLGTLGGANSYVNALNNRGDVLGTSWLAGDAGVQAFLYRDGAMVAMGADGQNSYASLLNERGTVAGSSGGHAFVFQDGVFHDLGAMGGEYTSAELLSENDVVVGGFFGGLHQEGKPKRGLFVHKDGVSTVLPGMVAKDGSEMDQRAIAVNDHGDVLGFAFNNGYDEFHSFVYRDGEIVDLSGLMPMLNGFPQFGFGGGEIDNDGRITFQNGVSMLVLTPTAVVPEAATWAYLLVGLCIVPLATRRTVMSTSSRHPRAS